MSDKKLHHTELSQLAAQHGLSAEVVDALTNLLDRGGAVVDESALATEPAEAEGDGPAPVVEVNIDVEGDTITTNGGELDSQRTLVSTPDLSSEFASQPLTPPSSVSQVRALIETRTSSLSPDKTEDGRYVDIAQLGKGGMGEVRLVRDRILGRTVAMKLLRAQYADNATMVARFIEEAQAGAQLQHPGMPPVHELGRLADGRLYFVMREIRGQTLEEAIAAQHAREEGPNFLSLGGIFARVAEAVGYAHRRGVIHRDLKPANVMLGDDGEVLVVDWGLARVLGEETTRLDDDEVVVTSRSSDGLQLTAVGSVFGTPAYMPPEQACGDEVDRRSDVYSLGAILYQMLLNDPPYSGATAPQVLVRVGTQLPDRWDELTEATHLPREMVAICRRAMAREPAHRHANAEALAADVNAWLDGSQKRRRALALVAEAERHRLEAQELRERAANRAKAAERLLANVPASAPEEVKAEGWAVEDAVASLEREAMRMSLKREQTLLNALSHAPDLPEAHEALAAYYKSKHVGAELDQDEEECERFALLLQSHADQLTDPHLRGRYLRYLAGHGSVSLTTAPRGAEVTLQRYEVRNRRLIPIDVRQLGQTPLDSVPLPMGSYRLVIEKTGYAPTLYPVHIARQHHWGGERPGSGGSSPVRLLPAGEIGENDVYVPAGWFVAGGDAEASLGFPRRTLWIDGFVAKRFQVTNQQFIAFLDDLVAQGREDDALRYVPRERGSTTDQGSMIYGRREDGSFYLQPDADGDVWLSSWPVFQIDWFSAHGYAEWYADKTGLPWRLPLELEWEKMSRGVDGRCFPWGNVFDPSWACMRRSHGTAILPASIHDFPIDESVYGVRGAAGNVMDWCADVFRPNLPESPIVMVQTIDPNEAGDRIYRGGAWGFAASYCRLARRMHYPPTARFSNVGFRLVRSVATPTGDQKAKEEP